MSSDRFRYLQARLMVKPRPLRVICIGEAMIELVIEEPPALGIAGDVLNTAVYLKRLAGQAADVRFASVIGTDAMSDRIIAFIEGEGIGTQALRRTPDRLPGLYAIEIAPNGERSFHYWRGSSAARLLFADKSDQAALEHADIVYFSGITLAILPDFQREALLATLGQVRAQGTIVIFDPNYRPRLWCNPDSARHWIMRAWSTTDIGFPSLDDELALFGDASPLQTIMRITDAGVGIGAVKRGHKGPMAMSGEAGGPYPPAKRVVDTTAAGDSFNAGYIAGFLAGDTEAECMNAAHALAAEVISQRGGIIAIPAISQRAT